jgi:hypothetical protein
MIEKLHSHHLIVTGSIALLLALGACGDDGDDGGGQPGKPQAVNPVVEGPVTGGGGEDCCRIVFGDIEIYVPDIIAYIPGTPFYLPTLTYDESEVGYRETEYLVSGTATSYTSTEELGEDGVWSVQPAETAPYRTRIVVIRPENAADFSGTVLVEWLNVTSLNFHVRRLP